MATFNCFKKRDQKFLKKKFEEVFEKLINLKVFEKLYI